MVERNNIPMICTLATLLLHALLCYRLVTTGEVSISAVGQVTSISNMINYVLLLIYSYSISELSEANAFPTS